MPEAMEVDSIALQYLHSKTWKIGQIRFARGLCSTTENITNNIDRLARVYVHSDFDSFHFTLNPMKRTKMFGKYLYTHQYDVPKISETQHNRVSFSASIESHALRWI